MSSFQIRVVVDALGCDSRLLALAVLLVSLKELIAPCLFHLVVCDTEIPEHCIGRRIGCASVDLENPLARDKTHIEPCACAFFHIELCRDIVIVMFLRVDTWLKAHDIVEGVLVP